jgi:hypothetical protein
MGYTIMKAYVLPLACALLFVTSTASAQAPSSFLAATCDPAAAATFKDVRLPHAVIANGNPLAAGSYQLRITTDRPSAAVGQSPTGECWVEFVKNGDVVGRELASVIPAEDIRAVIKSPEPKPSEARVDLLKGGDYLRVWLNNGGTHYLLNLSISR